MRPALLVLFMLGVVAAVVGERTRPPAAVAQAPALAADANGDGRIDAVDALCLLRAVAGLPATAACPTPLPRPDVNGDGGLTATDALCVLRYIGGLPPTSACPLSTPTPAPTPSPSPTGGGRVVGYFPTWVRQGGYTENDIDFAVVTHVNHFSITPRADGSIFIPEWEPIPDPALVNHAHQAGAKVLIVVGGWGWEFTQGFAGLAVSADTRRAFATNLAAFITRHGYDGADLDWEYPQTAAERAGYVELVREIRAAIGPAKLLTIAAPAADWSGQYFDIAAMLPSLDWVGVMTYDLHAAGWAGHSGHNAGLYNTAAADAFHWGGEITVDSARAYWQGRGVPPGKLLIGLPFYGQRFDGAEDLNQTLTSTAGGQPLYREVAPLIGAGWSVTRDAGAAAPYLRRDAGMGVISYEDGASITAKCAYAVERGLGGAIIWHLGQDRLASGQPLLAAARDCRRATPGAPTVAHPPAGARVRQPLPPPLPPPGPHRRP
jgi:chitinase